MSGSVAIGRTPAGTRPVPWGTKPSGSTSVGGSPSQHDALASRTARGRFSSVTPEIVRRNRRSGAVARTTSRPSSPQASKRPGSPAAVAASHATAARA
ncbi:hypothetical protein [Amycolatopsis japonica]|uniref:hypothetical protein n=1 Tax=Amycolatopsis japonica TaxID=208439 RepID=UPI00130D524D|nr:hypothetical protein [Amycolatopsis japonica]